MIRWTSFLVTILITLQFAPSAAADDASSTARSEEETVSTDAAGTFDELRVSLGARVGGYMFREQESGRAAWDGCRMDGAGLFANLDLNKDWFTELSFDFYAAHADVVEEGMDRVSLLTLVAAGFRMFPDWYVSPNIHVGGGVEYTHVELLNAGKSDDLWAPVGFIGLGVEGNIGDHFRVGTSLRILAMLLPDHHHEEFDGVGASGLHAEPSEVDAAIAPAGQLQIFVRYAL